MKRFSMLAVLWGSLVFSLFAARSGFADTQGPEMSDQTPTLEKLQQERIDTLEMIVKIAKGQYERGSGAMKDLPEYCKAQEYLLDAKIEATDKPAERIALFEEKEKAVQAVYDFVKKQRDVGFMVSDLDLAQEKSRLLAVQIQLTKERLAVPAGGDKAELKSTIEKLQKERIEALSEVARMAKGQYERGVGAMRDLTDFCKVQEKLMDAKLDAAEKPAERVAFLEEKLKLAQEVYDYVKKMADVGFRVGTVELNCAKAKVLAVKIQLAKERSAGEPREEKTEPMSNVEELQKERIDALTEVVQKAQRQYETGAGGGRDLRDYCNMQEDLMEAKLAATTNPEDRVALLKDQLKTARGVYDYCEKAQAAGFANSKIDLLKAQSHCLAIEIKLAKENKKKDPPRL